MIKFFRKIRQSLINNGQTTKYFKYAIGEIVLVVIGILIALSINNWNETRKKQKLEKVLLIQLKDEILSVKGDLEKDLNWLSLCTESYFKVVDYIQNDVRYNDSMCFDFYFLKQDEYIYPQDAVYSKIKNEGLDIIQNDSIKIYLQSLYEYLFPRISKDHAFFPDLDVFFSDYYQQHFRPNNDLTIKFRKEYPNDTIYFPKTVGEIGKNRLTNIGYIPLDFEALKKDYKFQMLLNLSFEYRQHKYRTYLLAQKRINQVITLIDKELGND